MSCYRVERRKKQEYFQLVPDCDIHANTHSRYFYELLFILFIPVQYIYTVTVYPAKCTHEVISYVRIGLHHW